MPLKPKRDGYIWRQQVAAGRSAARKQRQLLANILERRPDRAELYQILTAIALLSSQIDDTLEGLEKDFRNGP